jgi:hypothetical protein
MVVRSWVGRASVGWVLVCLLACTTGPAFIELIDEDSGESMQFLVPRVGSQAAGPDEIGDLAGNMTDVRHNLTRRYAAFMLDGDVVFDPDLASEQLDFQGAVGSPAHGLLLPPAESFDDPIRVDIRAFDPMKWSSFRTYDRGECSAVVGWEQLAGVLAARVLGEIERNDDITGARLREARLRPRLQSRPLDELEGIAVLNTDRLEMEIDFEALTIGPCLNATASLEFTMELEPTPLAFFQVPAISFWKACVDGDLLRDEKYLDVGEARAAVSNALLDECECLGIFPFGRQMAACQRCLDSRDADWRSFYDELAQGNLPACALRDDAFVVGQVAGLPMAGFEDIRLLSDLGRVDINRHADVAFIGYLRMEPDYLPFGPEARSLEARDPLFHVTNARAYDVDGDHLYGRVRVRPARRCGPVARRHIRNEIEEGLRKGLPGGLADAINDMLMLDPFIATGGVPDVEEMGCNLPTSQPDLCSFRFAGVPAYEAADFWRGARHKCMIRDSSEGAVGLLGDPDVTGLINLLPQTSVCHVRLEPRAMHVRPDGLEIVFVTDGSTDPQGDFFGEDGLIRTQSALCDPVRGPLEDDGDPMFVGSPDGVFVVSGVD